MRTGFFSSANASLSPCRRYRYRLDRVWDSKKPRVTFVMLNPSTADEHEDDPTMRRVIEFAKSWEMGGVIVVNLFAWRSPDPKALKRAHNPIEEEEPERWPAGRLTVGSNALHITRAARESEFVVVAWGAGGSYLGQDDKVINLLKGYWVRCFGYTKAGHPRHPLFIEKGEPLETFRRRDDHEKMRPRRIRLRPEPQEETCDDGQEWFEPD